MVADTWSIDRADLQTALPWRFGRANLDKSSGTDTEYYEGMINGVLISFNTEVTLPNIPWHIFKSSPI